MNILVSMFTALFKALLTSELGKDVLNSAPSVLKFVPSRSKAYICLAPMCKHELMLRGGRGYYEFIKRTLLCESFDCRPTENSVNTRQYKKSINKRLHVPKPARRTGSSDNAHFPFHSAWPRGSTAISHDCAER